MTAPAQASCSVCAEPSDGGTCCGRCGYPFPAGAASAASASASSPPPAPPPSLPQKSAASDLEEAFADTLPKAGSTQGLPHEESGAQTPALPQAKRLEFAAIDEPIKPPKSAAPTAPPKTVKRAEPRAPLIPAGIEYIVKSALSIAFLVGLAIAAVLLLLSQRQSQNPKTAAPRLAKRYLSALAMTDYASAYYLLSAASQARCSIDEFRKMRGPGEWSWGNLKLVATEHDAAEVAYDWEAPGQPLQTVYMFFVRENDRWVVPYNLNLLRRVEDAMRENDPDMALLESQEAVRVNPRDPMARAYLCEAANFRGLPEQAKTECQAALDLSAHYPSNLSAQSISHIKALSAALDQGK